MRIDDFKYRFISQPGRLDRHEGASRRADSGEPVSMRVFTMALSFLMPLGAMAQTPPSQPPPAAQPAAPSRQTLTAAPPPAPGRPPPPPSPAAPPPPPAPRLARPRLASALATCPELILPNALLPATAPIATGSPATHWLRWRSRMSIFISRAQSRNEPLYATRG